MTTCQFSSSTLPANARRARRLWLGAVCLTVAGFAAADGSPRIPSAVWAIGLPNGYVIMEHQPKTIEVTADDVVRGVTKVQEGTRIVITTTGHAEIALDFGSAGKLFQAIQIDESGSSSTFGAAGGTVVVTQVAAGRRSLTINYRFKLAPDTVPGTYDWPLTLTVRRPFAVERTHRHDSTLRMFSGRHAHVANH